MNTFKVNGQHNSRDMGMIIDEIFMVNKHFASTVQGLTVYTKPQPLVFEINTPNNYTNDIYQWWNMLPVIQYMQDSKVPILCTVSGTCRNAFVMMLIHGKKGMRKMYKYGQIEIQPIGSWGGRWQNKKSKQDESDNHKKLELFVYEILQKYTKMPDSEIKKMFWEELSYDAATAKRYGLIDEIIG